ncbi:endonuclease [bacterium]|nr:endonuclease [bacterium]
MKNQFKLVCLVLVVVLYVSTFNCFGFDNYLEKYKAICEAGKLSNKRIRSELVYNIRIGNITSFDHVKLIILRVSKEMDYYSDINVTSGQDLKDQLRTLISNHESLGYTLCRKYMYGQLDNVDGKVTGVYTGRIFKYSPYDGIVATNTRSFMNCEHTWPQSFFDKQEPMRSDIYHLFPTDSDANGKRGSYLFGNVEDVMWEEGESKLGIDRTGETVFEPRDCHKGNVARAIFYFSTCYGDPITKDEENVLRQWHEIDEVDEQEMNRNNGISKLQKNRNPFIDHPEWVELIHNF